MRQTFIKTLVSLAETEERIHLLTADLGYGLVEPFAEKFPDRFINVGVAEQNMIGIAAGLALSGRLPFCYSIAGFPTLHCLEQIRNDVCYHDLPVTIVAGGTGLNYGALGFSHHATEDIAVMRTLPNMTVIAPGDTVEVELATRAIVERAKPCYLRLGAFDGLPVHQIKPDFVIGKAITVKDGTDLTLIAIGTMLSTAMQAAGVLEADGFSVRVLSMHTIKPLNMTAVLDAVRDTRGIVTLEEHSKIGGLGSAVVDMIGRAGRGVDFRMIALEDVFQRQAASRHELLESAGLTVTGVVRTLRRMICRSGV